MAGGLSHGDDLEENHEINVTPFIDVMLVLLIIFMVAAPLATVDVNVDLPVSNAPASGRPDTPVWLTVGPDLALSLGNDPIAAEALKPALDAATGGDPEKRIFLRADQSVAYGQLMGVMNDLRDAGYLRIALVGLDPASAAPAGEAVSEVAVSSGGADAAAGGAGAGGAADAAASGGTESAAGGAASAGAASGGAASGDAASTAGTGTLSPAATALPSAPASAAAASGSSATANAAPASAAPASDATASSAPAAPAPTAPAPASSAPAPTAPSSPSPEAS